LLYSCRRDHAPYETLLPQYCDGTLSLPPPPSHYPRVLIPRNLPCRPPFSSDVENKKVVTSRVNVSPGFHYKKKSILFSVRSMFQRVFLQSLSCDSRIHILYVHRKFSNIIIIYHHKYGSSHVTQYYHCYTCSRWVYYSHYDLSVFSITST